MMAATSSDCKYAKILHAPNIIFILSEDKDLAFVAVYMRRKSVVFVLVMM